MLLPTAPLVILKAGAQGISIAVAFRSFDRTLQIVLFKQALKLLNPQPEFLPSKLTPVHTAFPPLSSRLLNLS